MRHRRRRNRSFRSYPLPASPMDSMLARARPVTVEVEAEVEQVEAEVERVEVEAHKPPSREAVANMLFEANVRAGREQVAFGAFGAKWTWHTRQQYLNEADALIEVIG